MHRLPRALPRLHVVTDDAVLAASGFERAATALAAAGGPRIALHLRGHATSAARLHALALTLRAATAGSGGLLFVNDRVDVASCIGADGVQLGRRSLPIEAARRVLPDALIGCSVHSPDEAEHAARAGTDFVLAGTIWPTPSHRGASGAGVGLIEAVREKMRAGGRGGAAVSGNTPVPVPVIAIGGVTAERIGELAHASAYGAAVLGGVWRAPDPAAALARYLEALDRHPSEIAAGGAPRPARRGQSQS